VHASASAAQTFYTVPVSLSDGSTARFWLGLSDWTLNAGRSQPSFGNQVAAHMTYRNCAGCSSGKDTVSTNVFYTALPVDPSKTLTGVTLPNGADQGELHIFAVGTSAQALSPPVAASLTPATAAAGQPVTINGSGFGASQGSGYVAFSDNGINWGAPGNAATFHIDSWSDTAITFTVPTPSGGNGQFHVFSGTPASVTVVNNSGAVSDAPELDITPTSNPGDYYDNAGISPDSNQACANYDGDGFSYSADALAAGNLTPGATVNADGLSFTWPKRVRLLPGQHPGRRADHAGERPVRVQHARAARLVHQRLVTGHDHDQLHRRHVLDPDPVVP
jgi:IPT/TIG domain